jgi:PmbA protein
MSVVATGVLDLAAQVLEACRGEDAQVLVHRERSGLARFAGSEVHQPTLIENTVVELRIARDSHVGSATTNRVSKEGFEALARRATEAADSTPADPYFTGFAPPSEPPEVEGFDERTAALPAEEQAAQAAAAMAATGSFDAYGFFTTGLTELAVATSTGLEVEQSMTDTVALVLVAGDDASGWAEQTSWSVENVDVVAVGAEAAEKAAMTRGAVEVEPAHYPAVLEPYAFAELLQYFAYGSFGGRSLLEGASYFCDRLGERVFDPKISIVDDALDPRGLPKAFDFEGVPKRLVQLVEEGIARGVVWDRRTAAQAGDGTESTGHGLPTGASAFGPLPLALSVAPGDAGSVDELIGRIGDGIYVTRLHYLSVVNPREGIVTGMTRDGTLRIRDGKLAEPLVNLRFTVSVPEFLAEVPGLTSETKLVNLTAFYGDRYVYGALVPAIASARFNVTGVGSRPGL